MRNRRIITYGVDQDTGLLVSRVGDEFARPVLDYVAIGKGGDFTKPFEYNLSKVPVDRYSYPSQKAIGHGSVPAEAKNAHRVFWGMKPLKAQQRTFVICRGLEMVRVEAETRPQVVAYELSRLNRKTLPKGTRIHTFYRTDEELPTLEATL